MQLDKRLYALLNAKIEAGGGGTSIYITNCSINTNGDLIVRLSDGTSINAGKAKGEDGATGATGATGPKGDKGDTGETGADGTNGVDGVDGISPTIEVATNTTSVYQLLIHNADGTTILTPNLLGSGATTTRYYVFDNAMYTNYLDSIYTVYNNELKSLRTYVESNGPFCNAESNHSLYYNTTTFGWDGSAYSFNTVPVSISSTQILLYGYISYAGKAGEYLKFVPSGLVTGSTELEKAMAIQILLAAETTGILTIDFEFVYALNGVTEAVSIDGIPDGEYYVVWSARSDNSRPKINDITIM